MSELNEDLPQLLPFNVPYTVCEILIGVMSVVGNGIVMIVFCREKKLRTISNLYIISLAFADFLLGLVGIPFSILVRL